MIRLVSLAAFLLLAATAPAAAAGCSDAYHKKDWKAALAACTAAAEKGKAKAGYRLGQMYRKGRGVKKDAATAAGWYRKAAELGVRQAQMKLGDLYHRGKGVAKDLVQAHMWVSLATAKKRSKAVADWLARLEKDMPAADLAKAKAMAADKAKAIAARMKK
jgi:TPR repeat protein